ncbi:hypothetical protein QE250_16935, partial [Chromatiaceae bacterium AAb-1]|nr:hypothetical protein [Chromatiaceae bacterium AAb-1]
MPRYIKGINNAVEYCAVNNSPCTLSENWPVVTYNWPDGMPRAMYIGDSEFSVVDAEGRKTIYYHRAIDEHVNGAGYPPGVSFIPRVVQVKDASADQIVMNYEYVNITNGSQLGIGIGTLNIVESARLNKAWIGDAEWNYRAAVSYDQSYNIANRSGGHNSVEVQFNLDSMVPTRIKTWDTTVWLYPNYKNQMFRIEKIGGENHSAFYNYDTRGNINKISYDSHFIEAAYPA